MRRVAITGLGLITPIASGKQGFWDKLVRGVSGISPVQSFDTSEYSVHVGAEVRDFAPEKYLRRQAPDAMGRTSQLAIAAARMAIEDGAADLKSYKRGRVGVSMGTTSGEPEFVELYNDARKDERLNEIPGDKLLRYPCHVIPSHVAIEFQLQGPCLMIPTACAAGNYAIGYAADLIRGGRVDLMLAGGADSFSRIVYMGFSRVGAIAPERCQPFDKNRKGMVPGEGAAVLLLEPLEAATARGAKIYAEVLGCGLSCDAHHMTTPLPDGSGAVRAMAMALGESDIRAEDVDYVSAHGTGTRNNDKMEAAALTTLFGDRARTLPMSSIKSMLGHTMGAASAIEAAACALALDSGVVPPTINYEEADPECEVDCVPGQGRRTNPRFVLNNAFAFGGNNASLCLARHEGSG